MQEYALRKTLYIVVHKERWVHWFDEDPSITAFFGHKKNVKATDTIVSIALTDLKHIPTFDTMHL